MSALTLPKGHTALLVMDCQNDIVHEKGKFGGAMTGGELPRKIKEQGLLETIRILAAGARAAAVPVIHIRHAYRPDYADLPRNASLFETMGEIRALEDGTWGADIHETLKPEAGDVVIVKTRVSAFYASPLEAILQSSGLTHLILTGVATDGVVEGTARDALDRGYFVTIPEDCCVGTSEEAHRVITTGILTAFANICQSTEVLQALA